MFPNAAMSDLLSSINEDIVQYQYIFQDGDH